MSIALILTAAILCGPYLYLARRIWRDINGTEDT